VYPKTSGKGQLPAWIAFDRQVLRFEAFFREAVHERREEQFRIRKCTILFYLEDDTIQVNEPVQDNSGIPQGNTTLLLQAQPFASSICCICWYLFFPVANLLDKPCIIHLACGCC
jgi:hypothetical protein